MKKLIAILSIWLSINCFGQNDFEKGYIITNKNDTLVGEISNGHKDAHLFVIFKDKDGKLNNYDPKSALGYAHNNIAYRTVHIPYGQDTLFSFAKVLADGCLTLYQTKLKLDALLKPKEAYLYIKCNENIFKPAGKANSLLDAVIDYKDLYNKIASHEFKDDEKSKIAICNAYNLWKGNLK